jgi:hypothetical protein
MALPAESSLPSASYTPVASPVKMYVPLVLLMCPPVLIHS